MGAPGLPAARRPAVVATGASEDLAPLDLPELRAHRRLMDAEDDRVSYWTCLTQARIAGLEAKGGGLRPLSIGQLVQVLGDTGSGRSRHSITRQSGAAPLPALPDMHRMWARAVDPSDHQEIAKALKNLWPAERQLTAYSNALHRLMDESTRELILRYRDNPRAALDTLPEA